MGWQGQHNRDEAERARYRREVPWRTRFVYALPAYLTVAAAIAFLIYKYWPNRP